MAGAVFFSPGRRTIKPRNSGITMIIDKGMGLRETEDLLEMSAGYIDFWKLGFATSALYNPLLLQQKIEMISSHRIRVYPGGKLSLKSPFTRVSSPRICRGQKELGFPP